MSNYSKPWAEGKEWKYFKVRDGKLYRVGVDCTNSPTGRAMWRYEQLTKHAMGVVRAFCEKKNIDFKNFAKKATDGEWTIATMEQYYPLQSVSSDPSSRPSSDSSFKSMSAPNAQRRNRSAMSMSISDDCSPQKICDVAKVTLVIEMAYKLEGENYFRFATLRLKDRRDHFLKKKIEGEWLAEQLAKLYSVTSRVFKACIKELLVQVRYPAVIDRFGEDVFQSFAKGRNGTITGSIFCILNDESKKKGNRSKIYHTMATKTSSTKSFYNVPIKVIVCTEKSWLENIGYYFGITNQSKQRKKKQKRNKKKRSKKQRSDNTNNYDDDDDDDDDDDLQILQNRATLQSLLCDGDDKKKRPINLVPSSSILPQFDINNNNNNNLIVPAPNNNNNNNNNNVSIAPNNSLNLLPPIPYNNICPPQTNTLHANTWQPPTAWNANNFAATQTNALQISAPQIPQPFPQQMPPQSTQPIVIDLKFMNGFENFIVEVGRLHKKGESKGYDTMGKKVGLGKQGYQMALMICYFIERDDKIWIDENTSSFSKNNFVKEVLKSNQQKIKTKYQSFIKGYTPNISKIVKKQQQQQQQ